ncbi:MAG: formyltransferase family protein [Roseiflexaceae bacterium]
MTHPSIAIVVSGGGSNLQAVFDAISRDILAFRVGLVLSDRPECGGIQRAITQHVPVCAIPYPRRATPAQRMTWEQHALGVINTFAPDLVLLSGFMRILSARTLSQLSMPVINQHPALLPNDGGEIYQLRDGRTVPALRGAHVVADALEQRLPVTGCTIHYVVPEVDRGPVIATREVPVLPSDDANTLHNRIRIAEQQLLVDTLANWSFV